WDPVEKVESFTVQPKFEGNALDFGMVIPTPSQPKLHEMPKDFFKNIAYYTILKHREFPQSKLLARYEERFSKDKDIARDKDSPKKGGDKKDDSGAPPRPKVIIHAEGVVGTLDYKVISADRADDLYQWLKDHKYNYAGDEATLNFYV